MINPITVDNFAALLNCTPVDRESDYDGPDLKLFSSVGCHWSFFVCCLVHRDSTDDLPLLKISSGVWQASDLQLLRNTLYLLYLCFGKCCILMYLNIVKPLV